MREFQLDYAAGKFQMYDIKSRRLRAERITKVLVDYFKTRSLNRMSVLDVGSSTGIIDNELAKNFGHITGIDIDKKAVEFSRNTFRRKNLRFKIGNSMRLEFPKNSFDVIICTQVYEHVPDAKKLFAEIYRVLKPGGVCYFTGPNKLWPVEPHYGLLFLSWLPKQFANKYVSLFGKSKIYYETSETYWKLRKMTSKFRVVEYTEKILAEPQKFGYQFLALPKPLTKILKYFTPNFFWLLIKSSR